MVITREKANMKPMVYGPVAFDRNVPVHRGVVAYEYIDYSNATFRRVRYKDPSTGEEFVFITTCPEQMWPG
jgi:hypothetical protein